MINFKRPTLEDQDWMREKIAQSDLKGCEYSFGNLFIWRDVSDVKVALVEGFLCVTGASKENEVIYNYPVGSGDDQKVLQILIEDAKEKGCIPRFRGVLEEQKERFEALFPNNIEVETNEADWDYIYDVEKLTNLPGKHYHGKRNHIARFKDDDDWVYEEITEEKIEECKKMNQIWCKEYGCGKSESAKLEQCAVEQSFLHFNELGFEGGLLRKAGEVVAFTIGEPLNSDTYVVHIEKAFPQVQGSYPMINQQFVAHNMQQFTYVNREEDIGDEGIRKAKMSYRPQIHLKKYVVTIK